MIAKGAVCPTFEFNSGVKLVLAQISNSEDNHKVKLSLCYTWAAYLSGADELESKVHNWFTDPELKLHFLWEQQADFRWKHGSSLPSIIIRITAATEIEIQRSFFEAARELGLVQGSFDDKDQDPDLPSKIYRNLD